MYLQQPKPSYQFLLQAPYYLHIDLTNRKRRKLVIKLICRHLSEDKDIQLENLIHFISYLEVLIN